MSRYTKMTLLINIVQSKQDNFRFPVLKNIILFTKSYFKMGSKDILLQILIKRVFYRW